MESILKRKDGTQYKITVDLSIDFNEKHIWNYSVTYRGKGKKNWQTLPSELYDFQLRQLSLEKRREAIKQNYLRFVSEYEIIEVMNKYLETIKPSI